MTPAKWLVAPDLDCTATAGATKNKSYLCLQKIFQFKEMPQSLLIIKFYLKDSVARITLGTHGMGPYGPHVTSKKVMILACGYRE